ncbi:MAG: hypothetical protein AB7E70_14225 [Hyphomicrobiaceae bacterium]
MTRPLETLRNFVRSALDTQGVYLGRSLDRLGLPIASLREEEVEHCAFADSFLPLAIEGRFDDLVAAFEVESTAATIMSDGLAVHAIVADILNGAVDPAAMSRAECERALPQVADWWNASDRSANAAAVLGLALARTALACERPQLTDLWLSADPERADHYRAVAMEVLTESETLAAGCRLWARNRYEAAAALAASPVETARRFQAALAFDTYDVSLYLMRTRHLLASKESATRDIETFARASLARTRDRFGAMLYARVHLSAARFVPLETLDPDRRLLLDGLDDWLQRFPSQFLANQFASIAHWARDLERVKELFRSHIREIHIDAWRDASQPYLAWEEAGLAPSRQKGNVG